MLKFLILLLFPSASLAGGSGLAHIDPLILLFIILFIVITIVIIWALCRFLSGGKN
jgi:hypothetical protein